jgi:hypothetical protein
MATRREFIGALAAAVVVAPQADAWARSEPPLRRTGNLVFHPDAFAMVMEPLNVAPLIQLGDTITIQGVPGKWQVTAIHSDRGWFSAEQVVP